MPIGLEKKLTVTLRFLATGKSYDSSMYQFRIHKSTITQYISKICGETQFFKESKPSFNKYERRVDDICAGTVRRWQFPNCIGAVDGIRRIL